MDLIERIIDKQAKIGVIGLGYVGLPLVIEFCRAGFHVTGFDVDGEKIAMLRDGKSYIRHIDASRLAKGSGLRADGAVELIFTPTNDFSLLVDMDCILMCVPTPLNRYREPDMSYVFNTARMVAKYLRKGKLIVLESTTYPGTTDEDMRAILEESGLKAGEDFHLAFSPEREDPNNGTHSTRTIPKVVGGYTPRCLETARTLYDQIVLNTVPVSSTKVAEATKLLENIYRSVNIALINELKMLFDKMDIDVWEVIEAAKTKPFGFQAFYPGPGLGGHCIPIDPFYLTWKAREYDFVTRFIELAGEINTSMPAYVVEKAILALNDAGKTVRGSHILILGLAYKANVDDDRESPSYRLMEKLEALGATVSYHDPYIPMIRLTREFPQFAGRRSSEIDNGYDLMIIATPHDDFRDIDFNSLQVPVVDTRNVIKEKNKLCYSA